MKKLCDADSQGEIGYQIQQAMGNEFRNRKKLHLLKSRKKDFSSELPE